MAYVLFMPMLVDEGWSMDKIGELVNIYGTLIGSASMLVLGAAIKRWSAARAMPWVMAGQVLAVAALAAAMLLAGVVTCMALYSPLDVLMPTLMMGRAWGYGVAPSHHNPTRRPLSRQQLPRKNSSCMGVRRTGVMDGRVHCTCWCHKHHRLRPRSHHRRTPRTTELHQS